MKRCPECRRDYYDDTLLYCLDDGNALLEGPASFGAIALEPATIRLRPVNIADLPTLRYAIEPSELENQLDSIAILPFRNLSRGEDGDYFSDGLAEELLNVLAKIRGLRVAARTSAFSFKEKQVTINEVGRILNVATVLEGSVRTAGERVRISVQLIKVQDGFQLWSEAYDRTLIDIFAVQDDIAQSVVEELRGLLTGIEPEPNASDRVVSEVAEAFKGRADDPEAQRLMLLGRYRLDRTTREDTAKAIECFRQAIDIDPEFALCWAELARAFSIESGASWAPVDEGFARSRQAVERALALEPDLAEGHAQLGRIQAAYDWDLNAAAISYARALELAPGSSSALDGASILAYKMAKFEEAMELSRRVLAQDPLSAAVWHNLGLLCHSAGSFGDAETAFLRALEIAPRRSATNSLLGLLYVDQGRFGEAYEQAKAEPERFWRSWALAIIYHLQGDIEGSDRELESIKNEATAGNEFQIAEIHAMRGEADDAFKWLNQAIDQRDPGVTHAKVDPRLRSLAGDARWPAFLAKVGL